MTGSLAGTTVVVTGASRGIGRAIALRLATTGADLALWSRDVDGLGAVADELGRRAHGGRVQATVCDVTSVAAVAHAADRARLALTLVNNAGAVVRGATAELTDEQWRRVMAVNVDGTFHVTRELLPDLVRARGRIINIASRAGREGTAFLAAYCAAKHAVVGFTRALAEELRAAKVVVNAICPGSVDTAMLREGLPGVEPDMTPDDIARTALFLAEGAPDALTGTCIDVFG
jgi:NAD(P)-dependent dehydrogenase (short-subunit alcohol dehydrogenase family)